MVLCKTKYCRNKSATDRKYCHKCIKAKYREKNPLRASYSNLKHGANRRGIEFSLTFEEFKEFASKTDYMVGKGKTKHSYHIDRINEKLGYSKDNIQVLTNSNNVKKYLTYIKNKEGIPENFKTEISVSSKINKEEYPF